MSIAIKIGVCIIDCSRSLCMQYQPPSKLGYAMSTAGEVRVFNFDTVEVSACNVNCDRSPRMQCQSLSKSDYAILTVVEVVVCNSNHCWSRSMQHQSWSILRHKMSIAVKLDMKCWLWSKSSYAMSIVDEVIICDVDDDWSGVYSTDHSRSPHTQCQPRSKLSYHF